MQIFFSVAIFSRSYHIKKNESNAILQRLAEKKSGFLYPYIRLLKKKSAHRNLTFACRKKFQPIVILHLLAGKNFSPL
jgi:hypothetical protein